MTNENQPYLSDDDRVQLRQLAEIICETEINEKLFDDLIKISAPILEKARDKSVQDSDHWSAGDQWESFETFSVASDIIRELLLGSKGEDSEDDDALLKEAADSYGEQIVTCRDETILSLDSNPTVTNTELESILHVLSLKMPTVPELDEIINIVAGEDVPNFILEARDHGWDDVAVVEETTNFFLSELSDERVAELLVEPKSDSAVGEVHMGDEADPTIENSFDQTVDSALTVDNELEQDLLSTSDSKPDIEVNVQIPVSTDDSLSAVDENMDTFDEGEWELAEIGPDDELQGCSDFMLESYDHGEDDHHYSAQQILDDENSEAGYYEETPVTKQESTTLALIAEGTLYAALSDVLLKDFIEEAGGLIRKSRVIGPDWWLTREAQSNIADLLSHMLMGETWPIEKNEIELHAHRKKLQEFAKAYPHEPEGSRSERLAKGSIEERIFMLREEREDPIGDPVTEHELEIIGRVIEDLFDEKPTRILIEDLATILKEPVISAGRAFGWHRASSKLIQSALVELLLGLDCSEDSMAVNKLSKDDFYQIKVAIRVYRTDELTEDEFIAHYDQSRWPSIGASVDLSIFTIIDGKLQVLLIERGNHPQKGKWALPGGFIDVTESIDEAAARELLEETSIDLSEGGHLEQVKTYGYPGRDRRGYIISTLYATLIAEVPEPKAGDDAVNARFVPVDEALSDSFPLAFDHEVLLREALERVRSKIEYSPIVFDFLPKSGFTVNQLRAVYETVWGYELSPSDFRRRISQAMGALAPSDQLTDGKVLWVRGSATTFFPPLDRREVFRA